MHTPGETAAHLNWLIPRAESLLALARGNAAWGGLRADPAAVLLLVRAAGHTSQTARLDELATEPATLDTALSVLELHQARQDTGDVVCIDWSAEPARAVYRASLICARLARLVATEAACANPDQAWAAGLLATLGWQAMVAVAPDEVAACLSDPRHSVDPVGVERQRWGYDHASIARRVARHWQLPPWLATIAGSLALPTDTAITLGADRALFQVVQLAVALARQQVVRPYLPVGTTIVDLSSALGLSIERLKSLQPEIRLAVEQPLDTLGWAAPRTMPLLRELLALATDNRRCHAAPVLRHLERDLDTLQHTLAVQRSSEAARLQAQKLAALAELAAGAGHEINNPLAVISGQAQYLLGHEPDPAHQRALQTIVNQTQRIHGILTELMQFARPPQPRKQPSHMVTIIREVVQSLSDLAEQRRVRLVCPDPDPELELLIDPRQIRTALACLLRNAIEAAPVDGWAGVRVQLMPEDRVEIVVEDSGSGPAPQYREHLFDPFYSSRQAGRGRGLGLPTAWKLAREHGGDVFLDEASPGPTRFVLSLPLCHANLPPTAPVPVLDPIFPPQPVRDAA